MQRSEAYSRAEMEIAEALRLKRQDLFLPRMGLSELPESIGQLTQLRRLYLGYNDLTTLPDTLANLGELEELNLEDNKLAILPEAIGELTQLQRLFITDNQLTELPEFIGQLNQLQNLYLSNNRLVRLPQTLAQLSQLRELHLQCNKLQTVPPSLGQLPLMRTLNLRDNPLTPELGAAYEEGHAAVMRYLRAKSGPQVVLNEAKLILVGEGEVGKSSLLAALRGDPWVENRETTHGIEIKTVLVHDTNTGKKITLNGWDFGGQPIYRPTHQLFFSAPAVYLVVWKPREGSSQGFVRYWIRLVTRRAPRAKLLVVATHGGPGQRRPDLDRQEIWDEFGRDTVVDFFLVDNKPDDNGARPTIDKLKQSIARVAADLPEMGRTVPAVWQRAREALVQTGAAYLSLQAVLNICQRHKMDEADARLLVTLYQRLGHLIHYEHDPALRDIVILKPDWLATAISFVLSDQETSNNEGLVDFARLGQLWNDPSRSSELRYPSDLHPVFLRLMERFDLSYRVARPTDSTDGVGFWRRVGKIFTKAPQSEIKQVRYTSLIAQLVPDLRPQEKLARVWPASIAEGEEQQIQICRIVDASGGQPDSAEGLFFWLIVRLHKYSLGRTNHAESVHWKRGMVLDDSYNGRALLEHVGNEVRVTVRAASPVTFLSVLTQEVKWLVENFWQGLRCEIVVPCVEPCGKHAPGTAVFAVEKLLVFKRQRMSLYPCPVLGCDQAQEIDRLLRNAPAVQRTSIGQLIAQGLDPLRTRLDAICEQLAHQRHSSSEQFAALAANDRRIMSQVEDAFQGLMQTLTDEARDAPRLFSITPIDPGFFDKPKWMMAKFRLTLWCEHSRLPLPAINGLNDKEGVYELTLPREWFTRIAPLLKVLTGTLSLVFPMASSITGLVEPASYEQFGKELDLAQKALNFVVEGGKTIQEEIDKNPLPAIPKSSNMLGGEQVIDQIEAVDEQRKSEPDHMFQRDVSSPQAPEMEYGMAIRASGAALRQLQGWLRDKDPGFGGLVRVQNKQREFLWVHKKFESEY